MKAKYMSYLNFPVHIAEISHYIFCSLGKYFTKKSIDF